MDLDEMLRVNRFFLRYRISHATRNFTSRKSGLYVLVAAARRCFKMVLRPTRWIDAWFYNGFIHWGSEPSKHRCRRCMHSTECPSSLVWENQHDGVTRCLKSLVMFISCFDTFHDSHVDRQTNKIAHSVYWHTTPYHSNIWKLRICDYFW